MGCTSSRPSQSSPSDPARPTTVPAPGQALRNLSLPNASGSISSASNRPNAPLRPPSPVPCCPPQLALQPWTASQLARERTAFFETRVAGDQEVWSALRIVCESLRTGDVASAQALMDAVGLTCPSGRIKADRLKGQPRHRRHVGVFDEQGRGYEIPGWVVRDPDDLVPEETEEKDIGDSDDETDGMTAVGETDEKGKGRAEEMLSVKARLSDRGTDVQIEIGERQKVRVLAKRIAEQAGADKRVRLVYLGKALSDDKTLAEQGWQPGHVVNALVFDNEEIAPSTPAATS